MGRAVKDKSNKIFKKVKFLKLLRVHPTQGAFYFAECLECGNQDEIWGGKTSHKDWDGLLKSCTHKQKPPNPPPPPKLNRTCSIEGCNREHEGLGYCHLHYQRHKLGYDLAKPIREMGVAKFCTVSGCSRKHHSKGYCELHRNRLKKGLPLDYTKPKTELKVKIKKYINCTTKGCSNKLNPSKGRTICKICYHKTEDYRKHRAELAKNHPYRHSFQRKFINGFRNRFHREIFGGTKKSKKIREALGCTIEEFQRYLETLFYPHPKVEDSRYPQEGLQMTWDNRGFGFDKWHIDHIIPLVTATSEEEMLKLWHYTNLRPLWQYDNLKKGKKIE